MRLIRSFNILDLLKAIKIMGKKNKLFLLCIFLFCGIELAGIPLVAYGIKGAINGVTMKNYSLFWKSLMLIIIKHLIWSIYAPISSYFCDYASKGAVRDIKVETTKHILKLPQEYHDSRAKGDLISYISNDITCLERLYDGGIFTVIMDIIHGIGGTLMMTLIDWRFSIVVFTLGTISVYTTAYFSKKLQVIGQKLQESLGKNNVNVFEFIKAAKTIRLLKLFDSKKSQYEECTEMESTIRKESGELSSKMKAIISGISAITYLTILAIGAVFVYYNFSDWGTIIALLGLKNSTDCLFLEFGQNMANMQVNIAGVKKLFNILAEKEEDISKEGSFKFSNDCIPLKANNISFSYDGIVPVLDNEEIAIEDGKLTALIGESGSGKTSLMKLLLALYEPDGGSIVYKGGEEKLTLKALRAKTAYVPQESMLFSATIFENISCGDDTASLEDVINAAKKAEAHEFIKALPQGYNTMILDDGKTLSGGEKQRIAIARALFKKAPILLLDEITSALDSGTEEKIMKTICNISKEKAVLMITHKSDIGIHADKLYELKRKITI